RQRFLDFLCRGVVSGCGIAVIVKKSVRHYFHSPIAVIENEQQSHDHENHFRNLKVVFGWRGQSLFEITCDIVSEKTDRAAGEAWQVGLGNESESGHDFFQSGERIFAIFAADDQVRAKSEKGIAA